MPKAIKYVNKDIRDRVSLYGICYWEIAEAIGVSDSTVYRWMRTPLSSDHKLMINAAIDKIKESANG